MSEALDTSRVELPGVSTPLLIARLSGMMLLCFAGALLTGYAAFLVIFLEYQDSLVELWTPWREAALGMFFWPFVIIGMLWAWSWAFARLWNSRWVLAGFLIICATILVVMPLTLVSPMLAASAGYVTVALGCVLLGPSRLTARR